LEFRIGLAGEPLPFSPRFPSPHATRPIFFLACGVWALGLVWWGFYKGRKIKVRALRRPMQLQN
jgi:hypothetical protein